MPDYFDAKQQEQPDEPQSTQGEERWPGFHFSGDLGAGGVVRSHFRHDKVAIGIKQNAKAAIADSNRGYDTRAFVQVVAVSRAGRITSFGFVGAG